MTLATYAVSNQHWTDMPEALPRSRARIRPKGSAKLKRGDDEILFAEVVVNDDGTLTYDSDAGIEVDTYADPKYKAIREEVRHSAVQGTPAIRLRPPPTLMNKRSKRDAEVQEDE